MITKEKLIDWLELNRSAADMLDKKADILFYLRGKDKKKTATAKEAST